MTEKHPFDPSNEEQHYFENSGCGPIFACILIIIGIFIVAAIVALFGE